MPAGEYVIEASASPARGATADRPLPNLPEYERAYYPGVPALTDAVFIRVSPAEVVRDINIALRLRELVTLTGHVIVSGDLPRKTQIGLIPSPSGSAQRMVRIGMREDGGFTFAGLKPGRYVLWAKAPTASGVESAWQLRVIGLPEGWEQRRVEVDRRAVPRLTITAGATLEVRLVIGRE